MSFLPESLEPFFTKDPGQLRGELLEITLVKSVHGFGFTIIGGDHPDEAFLQIKNVVPKGPAHLNGKLKTGYCYYFCCPYVQCLFAAKIT